MAIFANPAMTAKSSKPAPTGIVAGSVYPIAEFMLRLGMGRKAIAQARRNGLPIHRMGRRSYVVADEAIQWFTQTKTVA